MRHNTLRSALDRIATATGLTTRSEVSLEGKERPADLLITAWAEGRDVAVDLTVVHPLNASHSWTSDVAVVDAAEAAKVAKYGAVCEKAGVLFVPLGVDTFGACGAHGQDFLSKLFDRYAKRCGRDAVLRGPGQLQRECWERFLVAHHRAIGGQLARVLERAPAGPMDKAAREDQGGLFADV